MKTKSSKYAHCAITNSEIGLWKSMRDNIDDVISNKYNRRAFTLFRFKFNDPFIF